MFNSIFNVSIKKLFSAKLCQTEDVFLMLQLLKYTIKQNTKDFYDTNQQLHAHLYENIIALSSIP